MSIVLLNIHCGHYCAVYVNGIAQCQFMLAVLRNIHLLWTVLRYIHCIMWKILRGIHYVDNIAQYSLRTLLHSICERYCAMSIVCWQYCAISIYCGQYCAISTV
jgi:hypothetical protein